VLSPPHEPMAAVGPAPAFKKLQVRLKKVKCLDETNEPNDSDEILLGGVRLEPDGGVGRVPRSR
jgi:hypothetical protein